MTEIFTIETEETLTGIEAEIRSVNAKAMELRAQDPQAALDWLNQSEHLIESVSVSRQGRFYNQRALALKDLKEYDRAILEFDRAAYCFEESGEVDLQAMVHSNIGGAYSLSGHHARAHESIDLAIRLVRNQEFLIRFIDQKANAYLHQGLPLEALREVDKALSLLVGAEQFDLLAECLATKKRVEERKNGACATVSEMVETPSLVSPLSRSPRQGDAMLSTPLECVRVILQHPQCALPLFTLLATIADPDGDPVRYAVAWEVLRLVGSHTPAGERHLEEEIQRIGMPIEDVSVQPS